MRVLPIWPNLGLAWLVHFGFAFVAASLVPIVTPIRTELGLSHGQMGLVLGIWQLVYIAAAIPVGSLIDRLGARRSLFVGSLLIATSAAARGLATDFWTLMLAVSLFGLGGPVVSIGLPKLIAQWFSGRHRATASGIYVTGAQAGNVVALAITNAMVLPLLDGQWRHAMFWYGGLVLTIAVLWLVAGRDPESAEDPDRPRTSSFQGMRQVVSHRAVWPVIFIGTSGFLASHGFRSWLPQILESKGLTPELAGALAAVAAVAGIAGSITIMRLANRSSRTVMTQLLLITTATTMALIPFVGGAVMVGVLLVEAFCAAALMPLMLNTLMDMKQIGPALMGAAGGLFFSVGEVGGFLGPAMVGVLVDVTGDFTLGIVLLAAIILCMVFPGRHLRTEST